MGKCYHNCREKMRNIKAWTPVKLFTPHKNMNGKLTRKNKRGSCEFCFPYCALLSIITISFSCLMRSLILVFQWIVMNAIFASTQYAERTMYKIENIFKTPLQGTPWIQARKCGGIIGLWKKKFWTTFITKTKDRKFFEVLHCPFEGQADMQQ